MAARRRMLRWGALVAILLALVLVPFVLAGDAMNELAGRALAGATTWWAGLVIAGLLAADVLLPVPSSVLSTASGALLGPVAGTLVSFVGMTLGCEIAYRLGRSAGHGPMERLVGARDWMRAEATMRRHGAFGLVLMRPVPVLAEASVLFAGATRMPWPRFAAGTWLANLIIALIYAMIGAHTKDVLSAL